MKTSIAYVPPEFRPKEHHFYPIDNLTPFEEYFYNNYKTEEDFTERFYLPVFWTAYQKNNSYGQDKNALARLQQFIDALDKTRQYFSLVQYDDNILVDLSGIDIKVFSMSKPADYSLPLISMPHAYTFPDEERNIYVSFVGRITHPIREQMMMGCSKVRNDFKNYYISVYPHPLREYCRILAKSIFSLAPRGYGPNSFRVQESMQYGSIPVIITDEWYPPHKLNFNDFGVMINPEDWMNIPEILSGISEERIKEKQSKLPEVFEKYFTFEANKKLIIKALNDGLV